jgi:hypothetical protein
MAMVMPLLKKSGDESGRKVTMGSGNSGELFEKEVVLDDGNDATASASWIYKCLSHSNSVMFGFYLYCCGPEQNSQSAPYRGF